MSLDLSLLMELSIFSIYIPKSITQYLKIGIIYQDSHLCPWILVY